MGKPFKTGTYTIASSWKAGETRPEAIEGKISSDGVWGLYYARRGRWIISHIPTGCQLACVSSEAKARQLCNALSDDPRWQEGKFNKPPEWAVEGSELHRKLQDELDKL